METILKEDLNDYKAVKNMIIEELEKGKVHSQVKDNITNLLEVHEKIKQIRFNRL